MGTKAARKAKPGPSKSAVAKRNDGTGEETKSRLASLIEALGLAPTVSLATTALATGIVAFETVGEAAGRQINLYVSAMQALAAARARLASSSIEREVFALLDSLSQALSARVADGLRRLGVVTTNDLSELAGRIEAIDKRLAEAQKSTTRAKAGARTKARRPAAPVKPKRIASSKKPAAARAKAAPIKPSPKSAPAAVAASQEGEELEASREAIGDAVRRAAQAAARPSPKEQLPDTGVADNTMFIGSVPGEADVDDAPARASAISNEPDAMSSYLAKNPGDKEGLGYRRYRRGRGDELEDG